MTSQLELSEKERKIRAWLIILAFILFSIFVLGMVYLATNPATTVTATLSYAAGLSKSDFPEMVVEIIDISEHPDVAQKYMLMSTPGIVINGKLEFTGGVTEVALRKRLNELTG